MTADDEIRRQIAGRIRAEVEPLLELDKWDGGYNCCGCGTYDMILEHCIAIVEGRTYDRDETRL
jgi:hypothetical protein